jgi:hypothetical protein
MCLLGVTGATAEVKPSGEKLDAISVQALDMRDIFLEQLIKNFNPKRIEKPTRIDSGSALPMEEAVQIIQSNERGRQARELARVKLINKKQRQLADRRNRTGVALTHEMAVTKIQSALRGMLWRRHIQAQAEAVRHSRRISRVCDSAPNVTS